MTIVKNVVDKLFAHKRACDGGGGGSVNSERVAGSRLFGTDSYATAAAAAATVALVCARARTAGRAAAAVWASERARVALSTGATADPRARRVISRRDGCPALRVPNEICRETRPKNGGDFPPTDLRDRDTRRVLHDQTNLGYLQASLVIKSLSVLLVTPT